MFKRKQIIKDMQESISFLTTKHYNLQERITELERKTKELECRHNFKFDYFCVSFSGRYICYKCTECGKTTMKNWDNVAKKGQQALKLLNLVPKDWKIKGGI